MSDQVRNQNVGFLMTWLKSRHLGLIIYLVVLTVCTKLKTLALIDAELIHWKHSLERKKNAKNNGTDKQYVVADSFIHSKTCHT